MAATDGQPQLGVEMSRHFGPRFMRQALVPKDDAIDDMFVGDGAAPRAPAQPVMVARDPQQLGGGSGPSAKAGVDRARPAPRSTASVDARSTSDTSAVDEHIKHDVRPVELLQQGPALVGVLHQLQ